MEPATLICLIFFFIVYARLIQLTAYPVLSQVYIVTTVIALCALFVMSVQ